MSENEGDDGFARTYGFEFLFDSEPDINIDKSVTELQEKIGQIDRNGSDEQVSLFLLDHQVLYKDDKQAPSQLVLMQADMSKDDDTLEEEIQQSWQTPNAAELVERTKHKFFITDLMASGLAIKERHFILSTALRIFTNNSNCIGVVCKRTQQIVDSEAIGKSEDPLLGFINIRFYNAGKQGLLMDSIGLAALGIYDVQCHYVDLDPNDVSQLLYNVAYYVFNDEPEFVDGHTIEGINGQKWNVQFEKALVPPNREVLDINPGPEFAAGNR